MVTVQMLKDFGVDTDEGLARCYGNEALYLKLINMLRAEGNFDKLKEAVDANDLDSAFEAAHALKGVLGNLSVTPMYQIVDELTELLRKRTEMDYTPLVSKLLALRDELNAMCE